MKKLLFLFATVLVIVCFSSCDGGEVAETTTTSSTTAEPTTQAQEVILKIDKGTLADPESFKKSMEEYGAETAELSEEDCFEFVFSKDEHNKLLKDKRDAVASVFKDYEENEASYIDKVEYDDDFRNLKIYVNKEKKTETSNSVEITVASNALAYQTFLPEQKRTFVEIYYTGEEERVDSFTLPMSIVFE